MRKLRFSDQASATSNKHGVNSATPLQSYLQNVRRAVGDVRGYSDARALPFVVLAREPVEVVGARASASIVLARECVTVLCQPCPLDGVFNFWQRKHKRKVHNILGRLPSGGDGGVCLICAAHCRQIARRA